MGPSRQCSMDGFADGSLLQRIGFVLHNTLMRRNTLEGASRNIRDHYDVGNDFYSLWLDPSMTYSSALFGGARRDLEGAQRSKYERILSRLGGGSILEIGCGCGGFAERATAEARRVTGLTISPAQHAYPARRSSGREADIPL